MWRDTQCDLAKSARMTTGKEVVNMTVTVAVMMALVGKRNATAVGRIPAGQATLLGFHAARDVFDGHLSLQATLEYSPLGWPEKEKPIPTAELNVLFTESPESSGRREFL